MSQSKEAVTFVLPNKNKEYLLQQRDNKKNIPYPGAWVFPGGGIDVGEKPVDAVVREIQEEFEIQISTEDVFQFGVYEHDGEIDYLFYYEGEKIPQKTNEGQQIRFFNLSEIAELELGFGQEIIINLLKEKYEK